MAGRLAVPICMSTALDGSVFQTNAIGYGPNKTVNSAPLSVGAAGAVAGSCGARTGIADETHDSGGKGAGNFSPC